jgi:Putative peptidoglycan-binding domain-containing protein
MNPIIVTSSGRLGHRYTGVAAGIVFSLITFVSGANAADGNLKSMSMQLTAGGGIPGPLRVVSEDGQSWHAIKAGTELLVQGSVKVEMTTGDIDAFGIYWGECDGNECWQAFDGWKSPLVYSEFIGGGVKAINKWVIFQFPTSKILVTSPQGIAPSPYGDQIIAQCNAALSNGGNIHQGHSFNFTMPVTLAVDAGIGADLTQATSGLTQLNHVDYAKTIDVSIPVTCEPAPQSPSASADVGATLPPFEVHAATLHGSPSSYEGVCPVDLKLFMGVKSNIKGPFEARVEAKSGWKSKKYTFQTTEANPDGKWSKHFQDTLTIPIVLAPNQSGGGAGAAAQGIGQFGTVQPDPEVIFPDSGGTPSGSSQVQTGYNPGNLHEDSLRLNVSGGGKTLVSDWWRYSITCDPDTATFVDNIPQTLGQPVVVQQAFLAIFPEAPTDGSKCGLSVSGLIQTNVKNATVKFRLRNHQGNTTGWQTVQTTHANNIGQFVEYLDFSSSGQGVWMSPGGGWALPGAGAGSQAGRKAGTLQIVTEQPMAFEGDVASYDFACHDPAPAGLGTAPTVKLNPDLPDSAGDLVGRQAEPDVVWIQQRLLDLGYREVGKVDGAVGRRTRTAILAFKADNGVTSPDVV